MGNILFLQARKFVDLAINSDPEQQQTAVAQAKNALSSAYANSTVAEQAQLQDLQKELEKLH